jgi:hypothetical protein
LGSLHLSASEQETSRSVASLRVAVTGRPKWGQWTITFSNTERRTGRLYCRR